MILFFFFKQIIVERAPHERTLPRLPKSKFLVRSDFSLHQFTNIINIKLFSPSSHQDEEDDNSKGSNGSGRHTNSLHTHTLFLMTDQGHIPGPSQLLFTIYEESKDEDGFLYLTYASENTFG